MPTSPPSHHSSLSAPGPVLWSPWVLLVLADLAALSIAALVLPSLVAAAYVGGTVAVLAARGCYRARFTGQLGSIVGSLVSTVAVVAVSLALVTEPWVSISIIQLAPVLAVLLVVARGVAGTGVRAMRRFQPGVPTLVVGAGAVGARMAANLLQHPEYGLRPIGVVDDVEPEPGLLLPLLGGTTDLPAVVERFDVGHIVVAFGRADEHRVVEVLRTCRTLVPDVWVVPRLFELGAMGDMDELWGLPVAKLERRALRTSQWAAKRALDIVIAGALTLIVSPVMLVIAAAVKLSSPGPVLFRQRRVGQDGRPVEVLKFRSMRVNDDSDSTWDVRTDDRVTAIGRILRPTSLDELPQLLNVLRGDMSLVGPRPERPHFVEQFSSEIRGYTDRHHVPVGLTGLAQVNGLRGNTSIEDRATFDNLYIDNWSLWTDLVILFRTAMAVVRPPKSVVIDLREAEREVAGVAEAPEPAPGEVTAALRSAR